MTFDVLVVGGGHAGTEAAAAAAGIGARTLLITHARAKLGELSCNPAIGGLGKGHLVREIDALGGLMGLAADRAGIQFRLLNRSKGPAVRGPRAQIDRERYRRVIPELMAECPGLTVLEGAVEDLLLSGGGISGVVLADGRKFVAGRVVLTTGTFLRGVIHRGENRIPAGRDGEAPAVGLAERLYDLGLPLGRLKTGTPPRLVGRSIDWSRVDLQEGDEHPSPFSFQTHHVRQPQVSCGVTWTNTLTHDVIRECLPESAVYGGRVSGRGPRYCPSVEDKVVRFAEKTAHQIFLEPETADGGVVYPNGVSTSLSPPSQMRFLRTISGLEQVEVARFGYAIEYDFVDPRALSDTLELKALPGLYLAGQINGTTGYEEAAAQGLMAGLNAARAALEEPPVRLGRDQAYIGVLIDDLVTRGVTEPYRMFTSRAEFRLSLRADNADARLTPLAISLGLATAARRAIYDRKTAALTQARKRAEAMSLTPTEARRVGVKLNDDGRRRTFQQLVSHPDIGFVTLCSIWPELCDWPDDVRERIEADAAYEGYLGRQDADVLAFRRDEDLVLAPDLDYGGIGALSQECREKLAQIRPTSLGQAGRIEGVTPGALTALLAHVRRR